MIFINPSSILSSSSFSSRIKANVDISGHYRSCFSIGNTEESPVSDGRFQAFPLVSPSRSRSDRQNHHLREHIDHSNEMNIKLKPTLLSSYSRYRLLSN